MENIGQVPYDVYKQNIDNAPNFEELSEKEKLIWSKVFKSVRNFIYTASLMGVHDEQHVQNNFDMTEKQRENILGTLVIDEHILNPKNQKITHLDAHDKAQMYPN